MAKHAVGMDICASSDIRAVLSGLVGTSKTWRALSAGRARRGGLCGERRKKANGGIVMRRDARNASLLAGMRIIYLCWTANGKSISRQEE